MRKSAKTVGEAAALHVYQHEVEVHRRILHAQSYEIGDDGLGLTRACCSRYQHMRTVRLFVEVKAHGTVLVLSYWNSQVPCNVVLVNVLPALSDALLYLTVLHLFGVIAVELEKSYH